MPKVGRAYTWSVKKKKKKTPDEAPRLTHFSGGWPESQPHTERGTLERVPFLFILLSLISFFKKWLVVVFFSVEYENPHTETSTRSSYIRIA